MKHRASHQYGWPRRPHLRLDTCAGLVAAAVALAVLPPSAQAARAQQAAAPEPATPTKAAPLEAGKLPVPAPPPDAQLPAVDPIIEDQRFNSAIPSVDVADDPELDRPLESIEEFERAAAARQGDAGQGKTQPPGTAAPAVAGRPAAEPIGDAPINDPELVKALEPLDQFNVSPVQFAEDAPDAKSTEVAYQIQVAGLDPADAETDVDLRGMFDHLSALKDGGGRAANAAMVRARLSEDQTLMERILASEGWYEARVRARIERNEADPKAPLTASLQVTPGKRYVFGSIAIDATPTVPPDLIRGNLALEVGEPIIADRVQGAEAQVAVVLPQNGYPFAEVGQRDVLLDRETGKGDYTLPVTVGPRARFGGIETEGDLAFDARHVQVLTRFKRGELYDSRKVDDLRQAMVATGLFSSVGIEPVKTGQSAGDDTEYVNLMVKQDAGPPRTIAATAGYGTGQGFRVEATWTHRNLFKPEGALIVKGVAGTQEQSAGVTFRRSNAGQRDRIFELTAEALHSDYDAYDAYTGRLAARISRASTPIWQKKLTYAAGVELLATGETDYDFAAGERRRRTFYIGALSGEIGIDHSDDLLNPTKGFRVNFLLQPEISLHHGATPYVRARVDASGYYPVAKNLVLAGRVRVGTIQGAERSQIAPSRRLYAGGGGSVRGYGYQQLGPLDPDGKPLGGRSVNEAAFEARYRFGNYGVVAFFDVGQAYESTFPKFNDLRMGVGLGARLYTNFGPLRLDVATPINRRPGESVVSVYVSIGQAF